MNGDLSRSTYLPSNHYSSVRLQQGRVLLDAEWNESADIGMHVDRTTAGDVIGACGAPKHAPSQPANFAVTVAPNGWLVSPSPRSLRLRTWKDPRRLKRLHGVFM